MDPGRDAIIEVGAVRVDDDGCRRLFHTFVNPRRRIPGFVQRLTGISDADVAAAPGMETVAAELAQFIEGAVLVGHNILGFDAAFLREWGVWSEGEAYDTCVLARILLPTAPEYGLSALCEQFGMQRSVGHRAMEDAQASWELFLRLEEQARALPQAVIAQIAEWVGPTSHPWRGFFLKWVGAAEVSRELRLPVVRRANSDRPLGRVGRRKPVSPEEAVSVLGSAASRPDVFPDWDQRPQQRGMAALVAGALAGGERLVVEAGTGVGKSLAYLVPAACHALGTGERVVVSTATINLQEQLLKKDLPAVQALLTGSGLRACGLKGRRNYLCLHRFAALRTGMLTDDEAQLASRILVWLQETRVGDRSELKLTGEEEAIWNRWSAEGANCATVGSAFVAEGRCFLQRARRDAEAAHLVVVNHSLLLSDAAMGGVVVPPYEHLIIDEAHHLEDEATRQFGFSSGERAVRELLDRCEDLPRQAQRGLRGLTAALGPYQEVTDAARMLRQAASAARLRATEFSAALTAFMSEHREDGEGDDRLLLTRATRAQPEWPQVEMVWENLRLSLQQVVNALKRLDAALSGPEAMQMANYELLRGELDALLQEVQGAVEGLGQGLEHEDPARIVWLERQRSDGTPVVSWAPLSVSDLLWEQLYAPRASVVLTGATLQTRGGFAYLQERLGLEGANTVALGSPFDFERMALVLVPRDMPEPSSVDYLGELSQAIVELTTASRGRALVLFTSHADLRTAYSATVEVLRQRDIEALAQGIDGSPRQLVQALLARPRTVLFGTASFWEGVDIAGEALSLLIMARLPFNVPTEPVFAARSAGYDDPFNQYALPQAVLRFRQGFGRLIRTKTDRGVMVVLDRRIVSKRYGQAFLGSLPPCPVREVWLREMPALVAECLDGRPARV